ncbi:MAG TPA: hypothetical protein VF134_06205 [Candidatus Dormibacteraeota bacterium]
MDGDTLLVGEQGSGRIATLNDPQGRDHLTGSVPLVEGIARIGADLYVGDQQSDRVVVLNPDGSLRPFLQLQPVAGVEGVDGIYSDGKQLLVPDAARGRVLWVSTDGQVQRTVTGFVRPVSAWPLADGSVLIAEENGGRVSRVAPDGSKSVVATGIPLADEAATSGDRTYAVSITNGTLVDIGHGNLVSGFKEIQGLEIDHAGNPVASDRGAGKVILAVTSFRLLPQGAAPAAVAGDQAICIDLARGSGFAGAIELAPGKGYRVLKSPAGGNQGEVVADGSCSGDCMVGVKATSGTLTDTLWLRLRIT